MLTPFGLRSLSRQDPDYNNELMIEMLEGRPNLLELEE